MKAFIVIYELLVFILLIRAIVTNPKDLMIKIGTIAIMFAIVLAFLF